MDNPKINATRRLRGSILYPSTPGRPAPLPASYTPQERAADRVAAWVLSCAIAAVLVSLAVLGCAIVYSRLPVLP